MIHMIDWVCSTFILLWHRNFISCYKYNFKLRLLSAELGGCIHRAYGSIASVCLEKLRHLSQQGVCSPLQQLGVGIAEHPFRALPFGSYMCWVLVIRKDVPNLYGIFFPFFLGSLFFHQSISFLVNSSFPCDSILCFLPFFPSLHQTHHWFNQGCATQKF